MELMVPLALALTLTSPSVAQATSQFQFDFQTGKGLTVSINGIKVVNGSSFQFFAPGWTKGYYSSLYNGEKVDHVDADTIRVTFEGGDGKASGQLLYHRSGEVLHVDETFRWTGTEPALVEDAAALINTAPFEHGSLTAGGKTLKDLASAPGATVSLDNRTFSNDAHVSTFVAPWGSMTLSSDMPGRALFDARNYPQGYAEGHSLFWFGSFQLPVNAQATHASYEIKIDANPRVSSTAIQQAVTAVPQARAEAADDSRLPLMLFPKRLGLLDKKLEITGNYRFPAGRFFHFDEFQQALGRRFLLSQIPPSKAEPVLFDGGVSDLKLPHEAYRITVKQGSITVLGQDDAGFRHGLQRLALLAFSQGGHLYVPLGVLTDWPSTSWRGFHLFVGPQSIDFQRQLSQRVLLPLGFNNAVLQCERTAWDTLPNVRGPEVMTKADLGSLFKMYHEEGVEAMPMIESFGHAEWFFEGGKNLDLAINPREPYTLDPRKPETAATLKKIWAECIEVTHPKNIHFGLDEVDMLGMSNDPAGLTALWKQQMPILNDIAKSNDVGEMIWGDECLAPGEAIDATNGADKANAIARREVLARHTLIGDWHYASNNDFAKFLPSLRLWKDAGMVPIASGWYQPENIRSFAIAASQEDAGYLQTTWSGYTSSYANAIDNFEQYSAFVLAAEYSWSGRQDPVSDIGYDYREVFRKLMFDRPVSLKDEAGTSLTSGSAAATAIGRYHFAPFTPIDFYSAATTEGVTRPNEVHFAASLTGKTLVLNAGVSARADRGTPIAEITIELADGTTFKRTLRYGIDAAAWNDDVVCPLSEREGGRYAAMVTLPKTGKISGVRIKSLDAVGGLSIRGLTFLP